MRVNIIGFKLDFAAKISISEVFQMLESKEGKKRSYYGDKYLYYTDVQDELIIGLILRLKKDKNRITTIEEDGDFKIDIDKLAAGESSTEVSLFCMNPATRKGVFYSYFGGLSVSILRTMWKPAHNKVQSSKIKSKAKELRERFESSKATQKAEDEFRGYLNVSTLTTPATIDTLFSMFGTIKKFQINSKKAVEDAGKFSPNSSFIKKSKVEISFSKPAAFLNQIQSYIRTLIPNSINEDDIIRLIGETLTGEEKAYYIGENLEEFGGFEFDKFVKKLPQKKWSEYDSCDAIKILKQLVSKKPIVFGHSPKEETWRLPSAKTANRQNGKDNE